MALGLANGLAAWLTATLTHLAAGASQVSAVTANPHGVPSYISYIPIYFDSESCLPFACSETSRNELKLTKPSGHDSASRKLAATRLK